MQSTANITANVSNYSHNVWFPTFEQVAIINIKI